MSGATSNVPELLRAAGITKRFGSVTALDDVTLGLRASEVVALVGENGSGKSTLAKVLAGVHQPSAGTVLLDGRPADLTSPKRAADAGIALVAQEPMAVPAMSVAENVLLGDLRHLRSRVRQPDLQERAWPLLRRVGLRVHPRRRLDTLPSSDRQLVEIAKALASDSRVLVLDEVTTRLGERAVDRLFDVVRQLRDEGVVIVLITHRLREMLQIADRAVVLRDGRLVGGLARAELEEDRLVRMMVGRDLSARAPTAVAPGDGALEVREVVPDGRAQPITLDVRRGEVVGLGGLVGAGRTELLEAIAGIRGRAGLVRVRGRPVPHSRPAAALRAGVALVPEDRNRQGLVLTSSVQENLLLGHRRLTSRTRGRVDEAHAREAISRFDIRAPGPAGPVGTLSGGNQQKVVIARALAHAPSVLLLDEPTRGVDVAAREQIYGVVQAMVAEGLAVLLASSELFEILAVCHRVVVLHDGAVAGHLHRDEATEEAITMLSSGEGLADAG